MPAVPVANSSSSDEPRQGGQGDAAVKMDVGDAAVAAQADVKKEAASTSSSSGSSEVPGQTTSSTRAGSDTDEAYGSGKNSASTSDCERDPGSPDDARLLSDDENTDSGTKNHENY
jgi:hypothetical protein